MSHAQVKEFMQTFGQSTPECATVLDENTVNLRLSLIAEESEELASSMTFVEEADALTDLKYVIHGTAIAMGGELEDLPDNFSILSDYDQSDLVFVLESLYDTLEYALRHENRDMALTALAHMIKEINEYCTANYIDIEACMDEVHASNMSKLGEDGKPIYREDGKVLKGPNYFEPDLEKVMWR